MNIRHHQVGPGENEGAWKISDPSKRLQARAILHDLGNTRILHVCEISHNANCDFVIYCLKSEACCSKAWSLDDQWTVYSSSGQFKELVCLILFDTLDVFVEMARPESLTRGPARQVELSPPSFAESQMVAVSIATTWGWSAASASVPNLLGWIF